MTRKSIPSSQTSSHTIIKKNVISHLNIYELITVCYVDTFLRNQVIDFNNKDSFAFILVITAVVGFIGLGTLLAGIIGIVLIINA